MCQKFIKKERNTLWKIQKNEEKIKLLRKKKLNKKNEWMNYSFKKNGRRKCMNFFYIPLPKKKKKELKKNEKIPKNKAKKEIELWRKKGKLKKNQWILVLKNVK